MADHLLQHGFLGGFHIDEEHVLALVQALLEALADPGVQKRIADLGMNLPPADIRTPAAFAAFHKAEVEKWYPIVKAAGVKAE